MIKRADHFFRSKENQERLYELLFEQEKVNKCIHTFTERVKKSPVKYMKSLGVWKMTRKEGAFVDPYVWVSIALWMNPKIYAKVVTWLTDGLIQTRHAAGDGYKQMSWALKAIRIRPLYYLKVQKTATELY